MEAVAAQVSVKQPREVDGKFAKGVSGNPAGRPPTDRRSIADIQAAIERRVREKIPAERIIALVEKTFEEAMGSGKQATQCRKLIFDYFIRKPSEGTETEVADNVVTIKIENATFAATHSEPAVVDGEFVEVKEVVTNG